MRTIVDPRQAPWVYPDMVQLPKPGIRIYDELLMDGATKEVCLMQDDMVGYHDPQRDRMWSVHSAPMLGVPDYKDIYMKGEMWRVHFVNISYHSGRIPHSMYLIEKMFPGAEFVHRNHVQFPPFPKSNRTGRRPFDRLSCDPIWQYSSNFFIPVYRSSWTCYYDQNEINKYIPFCLICGELSTELSEDHSPCRLHWSKLEAQKKEELECLRKNKKLLFKIRKALRSRSPQEALKSLAKESEQLRTLPI